MKKIVKEQVLKKITPTQKEALALKQAATNFISRLERATKELGISCEFFIGGSFGKGTYLRGNFDIDFFCRFDSSYEDSKLSSLLKKIVDKTKVKVMKEKGSRDYYSGVFRNKNISFSFELIPVLNITKEAQAKNSTDLSPLHVNFVHDNLKKKKSLQQEIRLAKQFFKAKEIYGAESYINAFSGHTIEILIIHYGSLKKLLDAAKDWKDKQVIDVSSYYSSNDKALKALSKDKISNLVLIDPIVKERNAARALSQEIYSKFIYLASLHAKELTAKDFVIKKESLAQVKKRVKETAKKHDLALAMYEISISTEKESNDIVGSKLLKLSKRISTYFKDNDFTLFTTEFHVSFKDKKVLFVYFVNERSLPKIKLLKGPEVVRTQAVKEFLKTKKKYEIRDSRVFAYERRVKYLFSDVSNLSKKNMEDLFGKKISSILSVKRL